MVKKIWKLRDQEVCVVTSTSGQMTTIRIKILWSKKLGLTLKTTFDNYKRASNLANKISNKGVINTEHWRATYWPGSHFLDGYSD